MRTRLLLWIIALGCARGADPIPFEIHRLSDTGGTVEVKYQLLLPPDQPGLVAASRIRGRLLAEFFPDEAHVTADPARMMLARTQAGLLKEYDDAYVGQVAPTAARWQDERVQRVVLERPDILVIEHQTYSQTGGAHGNERKVFLIFNPRTGDELMMADLFKAGSEAELTERIRKRLLEKARAPEGAGLNQLGYWEKDIQPQNPYILKQAVGFHYNPYEIAPYSMGSVDVEFTFGELRDLFKPEGPLAGLGDAKGE